MLRVLFLLCLFVGCFGEIVSNKPVEEENGMNYFALDTSKGNVYVSVGRRVSARDEKPLIYKINLNAPYFENSSHDATINEQDGLSTLVVKLETNANSMVTNKPEGGENGMNYFAFDTSKGSVYVSVRRRVSLKDEKPLIYKINLNAPYFENSSHDATINEQDGLRTLSVKLETYANPLHDLGIDDSNEAHTATATVTVHVSRNPRNTSPSFIDSTGFVTAENETTAVCTNLIHLTATVPDESTRMLWVFFPLCLVVGCMGESDTAPYFEYSNYNAKIDEQDGLRTPVVKVETYVNPLRLATYKLVEENNVTNYFAIDAFNGEISVRRRVFWDDEKPLSYKLHVLAIEDAKEANTATARVTVHVNRHPPNRAPFFIESTGLQAAVTEKAPIGTHIITLTAKDPDESDPLNGELYFYFVDPEDAAELFAIDSKKGNIIVIGNLEDEQQDVWDITVGVSDQGIPSLSDTTKVTIYINRPNEE